MEAARQALPFTLLKSETVPLTRELAERLRTMKPSPTEREMLPKLVDFLRDRYLAGLFHPCHWVIAVIDGVEYRVNAQHSSEMLSKLNGAFPEGMFVHLDTLECPDLAALAAVFRQFDDRRSARTPADISGAYQGLESDLDEVPRHIGKLGVEAIVWHRKRVESIAVPKGDDMYAVFHDSKEHPFLHWLTERFKGGVPSEMSGTPIVAAMYATHQVDADAATAFWNEVVQGGRDYGDDLVPSSVLADWLKRKKEGEFDIKPLGVYQGACYAWNAMRQDKSIRDIKADPRKTLKVI